MKKIISTFLLAALLVACNSEKTKDNAESPSTNSEAAVTEKAVEKANVDLKEINTDEALVATALLAAPVESREGSTVIGYNMAGEFVTFKEGDNDFICLVDDVNKVGFSAACYHKSLEPFMARGRELRAQGKNGKEVFDIREEEIKSGKLKMGDPGSTLHIYFGAKSQYDPETSKVDGAQWRYVVYLPFATAESTGLPEQPIAPNHPWIMNPGTHRAHIMISPVAEIAEE
jgi:hypothetical protein